MPPKLSQRQEVLQKLFLSAKFVKIGMKFTSSGKVISSAEEDTIQGTSLVKKMLMSL